MSQFRRFLVIPRHRLSLWWRDLTSLDALDWGWPAPRDERMRDQNHR